MCGRYTNTSDPQALEQRFGMRLPFSEGSRRYNVAPTEPVVGIVLDGAGEAEARVLRWGLIPSWVRSGRVTHTMINARSETAGTKPTYRDLIGKATRRALLPADGFYEWLRSEDPKQPRLPFQVHGRRRRSVRLGGPVDAGLVGGRAGRERDDPDLPGQRGGRAAARPDAGDPARPGERARVAATRMSTGRRRWRCASRWPTADARRRGEPGGQQVGWTGGSGAARRGCRRERLPSGSDEPVDRVRGSGRVSEPVDRRRHRAAPRGRRPARRDYGEGGPPGSMCLRCSPASPGISTRSTVAAGGSCGGGVVAAATDRDRPVIGAVDEEDGQPEGNGAGSGRRSRSGRGGRPASRPSACRRRRPGPPE